MISETILPEGFSPETPLFPQAEETEAGHDPAAEAEVDPIEAQNEAAAAKAPVRGISGSGFSAPGEVSDFERGFDAADRW